VAAPLPDIITIVRGLLRDGDLDRSSATCLRRSANTIYGSILTTFDRVSAAGGLMGTIEAEPA
jgi:hypothetical protein